MMMSAKLISLMERVVFRDISQPWTKAASYTRFKHHLVRICWPAPFPEESSRLLPIIASTVSLALPCMDMLVLV